MPLSERRRPAVAGTFYPADPGELEGLVNGFLSNVQADPRPARGAIAPHAGLIYSGQCAAHVFARIAIPSVVVVLAPNHTGRCGARGGASVWARGAFDTPLGRVPIAEALAEAFLARCELASHDVLAHVAEHAIEVELPFLQALAAEVALLPIVLAWDDWRRCEVVAEVLADLVGQWPQPVLLLASSDMTHYESAARAAAKDRKALDAIERLDGAALLAACQQHNITMCGRGPAAVVTDACRRLGASRATVTDYRHSGFVTGDDARVVAYAGVVIE
jgi:AmmeMemoRadiSam system protein B